MQAQPGATTRLFLREGKKEELENEIRGVCDDYERGQIKALDMMSEPSLSLDDLYKLEFAYRSRVGDHLDKPRLRREYMGMADMFYIAARKAQKGTD